MWQTGGAPAGRVERVFGKLARALGRRDEPAERRAERRIPAHGTARVSWRRLEKGEPPVVVHLLDISRLGLAVRCPRPIPVEETILLSDFRMVISGVVRHCTADGKDFTIGVEVRQGDEAAPEHATLRFLGA